MHDKTTVLHNATQGIGPADVDIGNVDVPVLVRLQRLLKTGLFRKLLEFAEEM